MARRAAPRTGARHATNAAVKDPDGGPIPIVLPEISPRLRRIFAVLLVLYAVELAARNMAGLPVDLAVWQPARSPEFGLWQPLTRYLVQGNDVVGVLFSCLVLYFFGPYAESRLTGRQVAEILLAMGVGSTVFVGLLDAVGLLRGPTMGWDPWVTSLVVLFGLSAPRATIRIFFVLPVPAGTLAWGTGVATALFLLASPTLSSADYFGVWAATIGWWFLRGPGARTRAQVKAGKKVERDLQRFKVLPGGRDDDVVHVRPPLGGLRWRILRSRPHGGG